MSTLNEISSWLQQGRAPKVKACVQQAIDEGIPANEILEQGLLAGMNIIGQKFKNNEVFVPEVLIAARAMSKGIEILRPHLVADGVEEKGTVVLGTVKGDLHDIGKNIVKAMLDANGFDVVDLGIDVPAEKIVETAQAEGIKIIALSGVLTLAIDSMKETVEALRAAGHDCKVIIGGAPVSEKAMEVVGADAWAHSPQTTINICKGWAAL